jgi:hypothetical protein
MEELCSEGAKECAEDNNGVRARREQIIKFFNK